MPISRSRANGASTASISVVTRLYLQYDRIVSTFYSFSDAAKQVQRITSYPYKARLTLLLQTPHLWNCLANDLIYIAEFHIMCLKKVHVLSLQTA